MLDWTWDRRLEHPPVGSQGLRSTCLSWAVTASHNHAVGSDADLSVEYLHWVTHKYPPGRGRVSSARQALENDGQPPAIQWAYLEDLVEDPATYCVPDAVRGPFQRGSVRVCGSDFDSIEVELEAGRCPVVALRVTDAFLAAAGGIVLEDGAGQDGHAVVAVGAARYSGASSVVRDGTRFICVRNSWGQSWGASGHALISEDAALACVIGAFAVVPADSAPEPGS